MHFINEFCYTLIISIFSFLIFIHFTYQITLKQSLAQKLNLIFQLSLINWQINIPLWTHMGHNGWRKDGKTFIRCYTIALKFWDEFNSNFILLHFSCYRSIKIWHLRLKNVEKNNAVHLRLLFTYFHQNIFSIKKHLALVLKSVVHVLFCIFQTNLRKAVNIRYTRIFCTLPEWIRKIQMIQFFSNIKTWIRTFHG